MKDANRNGNILFIILIAVALFAALSFTITSGGRQQNPGKRETGKLEASKILSFANQVKAGVDRLRFNDCNLDSLDFGNTTWHFMDSETNYIVPVGHNPNAPVDRSCALFHFEGLGIPLVEFPQAGVDDSAVTNTAHEPGSGRIIVGSVSGVGFETRPELILQINYIREEVCREINNGFGLDGVPIPQTNPAGLIADFTGTIPPTVPVYVGTGTSSVLKEMDAFCYNETPSPDSKFNAYHFNMVLVIQ